MKSKKSSRIIPLILVILTSVSLASCTNYSKLPEVTCINDPSFSESFTFEEKTYVFAGNASGLKKEKILAYFQIPDDSIKVEIWKIKGYSTDEWLMGIERNLMGSWILYKEKSVEEIPEALKEHYYDLTDTS